MPMGTRKTRTEDEQWFDMLSTGPAGYHPRLRPLPPPRFVRPTVLTANYGDDGYLAALHAAPDAFPVPYIPPTPAHTRRKHAAVKAEKEPITISDDSDAEKNEGDYSIVKVTKSARPGIGANAGHQSRSTGKQTSNKGKAKATNTPAQDEVVVISDDEDVGTLNMAQTYAALIESIGGSTQSSNPTGLPGQSMALTLSSHSSSSASSSSSHGSGSHPQENSAAGTLAIANTPHSAEVDNDISLERRRQGRAALPAPLQVPEIVHTSTSTSGGPNKYPIHAPRSQTINNPKFSLPPRPKDIGNNPTFPLPPRPQQVENNPTSTLRPQTLSRAKLQRAVGRPSPMSTSRRPVPPSSGRSASSASNKHTIDLAKQTGRFIPARSSWKGFTPCSKCDMLLPTKITTAQLIAHRASMPHRLALSLPGKPEEILAASARRVQRMRNEAELKRIRVRSLLTSVGREAAAAAGAVDGAVGNESLLALTRQSNRGFSLLETFGWEAGIGIGWKEWRRQRRLKRTAQKEQLAKEKERQREREGGTGDESGSGVGGGGAETAAEDAAAGGDERPNIKGAAAGPSSIQKTSKQLKRSKKKSKDKERMARIDRLRAGGKSADSAIALSDSDGEDDVDGVAGRVGKLAVARARRPSSSQNAFMDFRFDSPSPSSSSSSSSASTDYHDAEERSDVGGAADMDSDSGSDSGTDVEWVGVETKRKKGESVHAWLLRKFDTTERAKRIDAGKKRKRGEAVGPDGEDVDDSELEDDDDDDDANPMYANGGNGMVGGVDGPIPAVGQVNRLEPLAVSIRMQHALDRSGVGASTQYRTPLGKMAAMGGTVDVLRGKDVHVRPMPKRSPYPFIRRRRL
ncbi:hypothetical protein CF327_g3445 [Tilletia walkeri]|nr:hypothetical protein CF327_g3445 [Tilletia walkeri]